MSLIKQEGSVTAPGKVLGEMYTEVVRTGDHFERYFPNVQGEFLHLLKTTVISFVFVTLMQIVFPAPALQSL